MGFNWIKKFENFFVTLSNEHYLNVFWQGLSNTVRVAIIGLVIGIIAVVLTGITFVTCGLCTLCVMCEAAAVGAI